MAMLTWILAWALIRKGVILDLLIPKPSSNKLEMQMLAWVNLQTKIWVSTPV